MERLDLVEAIRMLRDELSVAITASANEALRFEVGEVELEFQVGVERSAKGGFKFWVIELGGDASKTNTHTVRIPLKPTTGDGRRVLTGGHDEVPATPSG